MIRTIARAAVTTTAAGALALACAGVASAQTDEAVFTGQAQITIARYGYCGFSGEPAPIGRQTFTAPVTMVVSAPAADGDGGAEQNPLHFTLQTDQQSATGAFAMTTGQVARTPESGRSLAVQYWTSQFDAASGSLSATLTEDHAEEALAYNGLQVEQLLVPCQPQLGTIPMVAAMAEGTQLAGSLDNTQASIEIAGISSDRLTEFHVVTSLQRSS